MLEYLKLNLIITQFLLAHTEYYYKPLILTFETDSSRYFIEVLDLADCSSSCNDDCEIKPFDKLTLIKIKKENWGKSKYEKKDNVGT